MNPVFSIIIPAYNAAATLADCVSSALGQKGLGSDLWEVIVVDDCSTDDSAETLTYLVEQHPSLRLAKTPSNGGPGIARNVGISLAKGNWLLFLDSDDRLIPTALHELQHHLQGVSADPPDAIGFNWCFTSTAGNNLPSKGLRRDHTALTKQRDAMLRRFLHLQMDGSVIYTAIRRDLLSSHALRFAPGYHEDVDFIFKVYWLAKRIDFVDRILYLKHQRPESIINTITARHLEGFIRAWSEIGRFIATSAPAHWTRFQPDWQRGLTGVVATRLREIIRHTSSTAEAASLYGILHRSLKDLPARPINSGTQPRTQYEILCGQFLDQMDSQDASREEAVITLDRQLRETVNKTWSCTDLHHSIFLAPDQVRTCCKRFFINGEMRGDVPLLDIAHDTFTSANILSAKRRLHEQINKAESTPCNGCPFMEFKDWGPLDPLDIHYLSLEYHSICNLKCTYCSETYYGGALPQYDVVALVNELFEDLALNNCNTVVWGGGEPVVDKNFTPLIEYLAKRLPQANQRVLTNAVKHSKTVEKLLATGRITVTTSIDAGTKRTFDLVRGKAKLNNVLSTLKKYAAVAPERVTVKYIFTAENHGLDDVRGYANLIVENRLTDCNFQISSDFKEETISTDAALAMIAAYGLLSRAGARVVFFDDLLRHRLSDILAQNETDIRRQLNLLALDDILADPLDYPAVAIWGAGWQARYMVERSAFFKRSKIAFFVDQTPSKIGTNYFDRPVRAPEALLESDVPVVIAAAQNFPAIYSNFQNLGVDPRRLIQKLIL